MAIPAPRHDLQTLQALESYHQIDEQVASAAMGKFLGHLWYLSEELVGLALLDRDVSIEQKREMFSAMKSVDSS